MAWFPKERTTTFDLNPVHGLYFLDGDAIARRILKDWTAGEKSPIIWFPSGAVFELWEGNDPAHPIVHIFGELDLPLKQTLQAAYQHAVNIAEQVGYLVQKVSSTQLEAWGHDADEHVLITYDDVLPQIVDIVHIRYLN